MTDIEPVAASTALSVDDMIPPEFAHAYFLTRKIANTEFVPKTIRGKPHAVFACIQHGQEIGLGPMQSLQYVHVIDGRPSLSAEAMRALVARAGHRLDVIVNRSDRVTLRGARRDTGARAAVTWTMEDAQRAKLTGNPSWTKYPRSMLLARATSELCRMIFPDVVGGLGYTPEEAASIDGYAYELTDSEIHEDEPLVDPVTGDELDDEDELDAAWVAEALDDDESSARIDGGSRQSTTGPAPVAGAGRGRVPSDDTEEGT